MIAVLAILRTETVRIFRDRTGAFFIFVLPFMIIFLVGTAFPAGTSQLKIAVIDGDGGTLSAGLLESVDQSGTLDVQPYDDRGDLDRDVRLGDVFGGLVIPSGSTESAARGEQVVLEVVLNPSSTSAPIVQASLTGAINRFGESETAIAFVVGQVGVSREVAAGLVDDVTAALPRGSVTEATVGGAAPIDPSSFAFTAASQLVLFMFVNCLAVGALLVNVRQLGIGKRLRVSPVSVGSVLVGYVASRFVFAAIQAVIIIAVSAVVFDVGWGDPLAASVLTLLWAALSAAAGVLVGAVARTPEQTQSVGIPLALGMAMLGGAVWPLFIVPDLMQTIGHATPHAWVMDAWLGVIFDGEGLGDIVPEVTVLVAFTAVLMAFGVKRLRVSLAG